MGENAPRKPCNSYHRDMGSLQARGLAARGSPNEERLPFRAAGRSRSRIFLAIKNRELVARKDGRAKRDHRR